MDIDLKRKKSDDKLSWNDMEDHSFKSEKKKEEVMDEKVFSKEKKEEFKKEEKELELKSASTYEVHSYKSFDDLDLKENLLRGVYSKGFEVPSAVQQKAIKPFTLGYEIICQAQSGTGKTGTFTISILQGIDTSLDKLQAIVLSPTRELANQTNEVFNDIAQYMDGIKIHCCVGGTQRHLDIEKLRRGVHVMIGTPGRVFDMITQNDLRLDLRSLKYFVLDEADQMLERGFKEQIYEIITKTGMTEKTRICLFSATMPDEILDLTKKFIKDPLKILIKKDEVTLDGIKQYYVDVGKREYKFETLCDLYQELNIAQAIIFCNKKSTVD